MQRTVTRFARNGGQDTRPLCLYAFELEIEACHGGPPHRHEATELVVCLGTTGILHQERQALRLSPDSIAVYQPGSDHWVEGLSAGRQLCVCMTGGAAGSLLPGCWTMDQRTAAAASVVRGELAHSGPDQGQRLDLASGLLALAVRELSSPSPGAVAPAAAARRLIDERFGDSGLSIGEVASRVYTSPDYLRLAFRRSFGESPLHYLLRRRIDHACHLLEVTDLPIGAVGETCGIIDPYYFSRLFRQITGKTPTIWRCERVRSRP